MLITMGGRPSREPQPEPIYVMQSAQKKYGPDLVEAKTGTTVIKGATDAIKSKKYISAVDHWTTELSEFRQQLSRWQSFRAKQAQVQPIENSFLRTSNDDVEGRRQNSEYSPRLADIILQIRNWRCYSHHQQSQVDIAAYNKERAWDCFGETHSKLAAEGLNRPEEQLLLIKWFCELDKNNEEWETETAISTWASGQFQVIYEQALEVLSQAEIEQLEQQQVEDANNIRSTLSLINGSIDSHPQPLREAHRLKRLVDREMRVLDLMAEFREWSETLPDVLHLETMSKGSSGIMARKINDNLGLWWRQLISHRRSKLDQAISWVSRWETFSEHWKEMWQRNDKWSDFYFMGKDLERLVLSRQKQAQEGCAFHAKRLRNAENEQRAMSNFSGAAPEHRESYKQNLKRKASPSTCEDNRVKRAATGHTDPLKAMNSSSTAEVSLSTNHSRVQHIKFDKMVPRAKRLRGDQPRQTKQNHVKAFWKTSMQEGVGSHQDVPRPKSHSIIFPETTKFPIPFSSAPNLKTKEPTQWALQNITPQKSTSGVVALESSEPGATTKAKRQEKIPKVVASTRGEAGSNPIVTAKPKDKIFQIGLSVLDDPMSGPDVKEEAQNNTSGSNASYPGKSVPEAAAKTNRQKTSLSNPAPPLKDVAPEAAVKTVTRKRLLEDEEYFKLCNKRLRHLGDDSTPRHRIGPFANSAYNVAQPDVSYSSHDPFGEPSFVLPSQQRTSQTDALLPTAQELQDSIPARGILLSNLCDRHGIDKLSHSITTKFVRLVKQFAVYDRCSELVFLKSFAQYSKAAQFGTARLVDSVH